MVGRIVDLNHITPNRAPGVLGMEGSERNASMLETGRATTSIACRHGIGGDEEWDGGCMEEQRSSTR